MQICRKNCCQLLWTRTKQNKFANMNKEDIFLQQLIESRLVQNTRNRIALEELSKHKNLIRTYTTLRLTARKRKFWRKLHGVTVKGLYPFWKVESENKGLRDLRETAPTLRHNVVSGEYSQRVHEFVESFPTKQVHYLNNINKTYVSAAINIKVFHEMFKNKNSVINDQAIKYIFFMLL